VVKFELLLGDYHAMSRHVGAGHRNERLLWFAAIFVASFSLVILGRDGRTFFAGMLAGFLLMLVRMFFAQRRLQPQPGGALLCRYEVQLSSSGVHVQTPNWMSDIPWCGVRAVEETAAHCFLRTDTICVHTVPKRAFPNSEAMRQFIDFARNSVSRTQPVVEDSR
jgi:hypothetical protein